MKSGFSLAPIGEFSFIIASLGISLGVMDAYLYPVIVSASILTTIITPALIRRSGSVSDWLLGRLPERAVRKLESYSSDDQVDESSDPDWGDYMGGYLRGFLIYGVIMAVAAIAGTRAVFPALEGMMPDTAARILACVLIYAVMALFLRPFMDRHNTAFTHLWFVRRANRPPLVSLIVMKIITLLLIAYLPLERMFGAHRLVLLVLSAAAVFIAGRTDLVATAYLQVETRFLRNLNERIIQAEQERSPRREWLDEDMNIMSFYVPEDAPFAGRTLNDLQWGRGLDVLAVKIRRGRRYFLLPSGDFTLRAGDKIFAVGERNDLENFRTIMKIDSGRGIRTLRKFMETDYEDTEHALACVAVKVCGEEPFAGTSIKNSGILTRAHCMVLGIEKDGLSVVMPDVNMMIQKGDILWLMGSNNHVGLLAALSRQADA